MPGAIVPKQFLRLLWPPTALLVRDGFVMIGQHFIQYSPGGFYGSLTREQ